MSDKHEKPSGQKTLIEHMTTKHFQRALDADKTQKQMTTAHIADRLGEKPASQPTPSPTSPSAPTGGGSGQTQGGQGEKK